MNRTISVSVTIHNKLKRLKLDKDYSTFNACIKAEIFDNAKQKTKTKKLA